jgi:hypothetical protein
MSVLATVTGWKATTGGEHSSGWLPRNAATPLPTPVREHSVDFEILEETGGCLLVGVAAGPECLCDSWFPTEQEAKEAAEKWFGIPASAWRKAG